MGGGGGGGGGWYAETMFRETSTRQIELSYIGTDIWNRDFKKF